MAGRMVTELRCCNGGSAGRGGRVLPVSRRYPTAFWANATLEKMIIFALTMG